MTDHEAPRDATELADEVRDQTLDRDPPGGALDDELNERRDRGADRPDR